jgi:Rad3-related DNA helicase
MSAILSHRSADYLGVSNGDSRAWIEMDSHFPPENTPIWHIPTARINYRTDDYGSTIWCSRIDQIIQRRLDRKGIVFTVCYERAKMLLSRSRFKDIMFTHSTGDVVQVVEKFKKAPAPAVLVSPSVTSGWDFSMDISGHGKPQYGIVGKIPYPLTKDPVTQARHEEDKDWTAFLAMETFVQECGRLSRSQDDLAELFVVDDVFIGIIVNFPPSGSKLGSRVVWRPCQVHRFKEFLC